MNATIPMNAVPPQARGWLHFAAVDFHLRFPNALTRRLFPDERWRAFRFAMQPVVDAYRARPYDGPAIAVFSNQTQSRPRKETDQISLGVAAVVGLVEIDGKRLQQPRKLRRVRGLRRGHQAQQPRYLRADSV